MHRFAPVPLVILVVVATLLVGAAPAAAHSVDGAGATNFVARLLSVEPQVPGITIRVVEHGSRFEVTNATAQEVVVLGYQGEPYLRIGPDGVFENVRSPATYLNRDLSMTAELPPEARADAEPEWRLRSAGSTARWHDHGLHWMGDEDPPQVQAEPGKRHVVIPAEVVLVLTHGDTTVEATTELLWVPGPSPLPWLALAFVLLAATAAASVNRRWGVALAVATALLVAVDVAHVVGTAAFSADGLGNAIGRTLTGSIVSIVGWVAGVVAIALLARRRPRGEGLLAAGIAGVSVAVNGGVADLSDLSRSHLSFAWSELLARGAVAVAIGVGLGLVVAAFIGVQRHPVPLLSAQSKPGGTA